MAPHPSRLPPAILALLANAAKSTAKTSKRTHRSDHCRACRSASTTHAAPKAGAKGDIQLSPSSLSPTTPKGSQPSQNQSPQTHRALICKTEKNPSARTTTQPLALQSGRVRMRASNRALCCPYATRRVSPGNARARKTRPANNRLRKSSTQAGPLILTTSNQQKASCTVPGPVAVQRPRMHVRRAAD